MSDSKTPSAKKSTVLYVAKCLMEKSDAEHPVSLPEILRYLSSFGFSASRKTIYEDIRLLQEFGLDIIMVHSKTYGYYIGNRTFEVPELKLLADIIQSSQFITEKKTKSLIQKLETLTSAETGKILERDVYVKNRVKNMNESIYYSIDSIHDALSRNRMISFRYFGFDISKKKVYRHEGGAYTVSPYALSYDNEYYYLIAYDSESAEIRHYRVDRMERIIPLEKEREGKEAFEKYDMSVYTKQAFSMYSGKMEHVRIEFENHLVKVVLDRFGKDTAFVKSDENHFSIVADVMVSPQFYAWIFGLTPGARILSPANVVEEMKSFLESAASLY